MRALYNVYIYIYPLRDHIGPSFPHSLLRTRGSLALWHCGFRFFGALLLWLGEGAPAHGFREPKPLPSVGPSWVEG